MSRFVCTPAGAVASGRRRLRLILIGPAVVMLAATAWSWLGGQVFAGVLCFIGAMMLFVTWRMANQLEPLHFEFQGDRLEVRLRWRLFHIDLQGATARILTADEMAHVESLASAGGLVATSGGYDSHLLGEFDLYASNMHNAVLLEAEDSRFVLTPDDPRGFVESVGTIRPE